MVSDGPFTEGLRINTVVADKTAVLKPDVGTPRGVDFFPGSTMSPQNMEAKLWLDAIEANDQSKLIVQPEQALTVTKILDAVYKSSETGELVKF